MGDKKIIKTSGSILVNKDASTVFVFFANPANDPLWRTEINQSIVHGKLEAGARISEFYNLSKKAPNNLIELTCVAYDQNRFVLFETADKAQFYLKSLRQVTAINNNKTKITYTLCFDKELVTFALGFSLPTFLIKLKAGSDLKKYLKQLKNVLEKT